VTEVPSSARNHVNTAYGAEAQVLAAQSFLLGSNIMNIKERTSDAIKILSDPFADEQTWLPASQSVGQNELSLLPRGLKKSREDDFTDSYFGVTAGVCLSVMVFTPQHYVYAVVFYSLMMLGGIIYLNSPARAWHTNFFVGFALAVTFVFTLLTLAATFSSSLL
jgi:hypothetical protein